MKRVFKSEKFFRTKLDDYLYHCKDEKIKKLPNVAGFCSYCKIKRSDFLELEKQFPMQFDITMSTFTDEAINTKSPNTGATIEYITNIVDRNHNAEVVCEHNPYEDGA